MDERLMKSGELRHDRAPQSAFTQTPWSIPLPAVNTKEGGVHESGPLILKNVDEIFDELYVLAPRLSSSVLMRLLVCSRQQGPSYLYQQPLSSKNITREPCRYLVPNSTRSVLGVVTLTPVELIFEPQ